MMPQAVMESLIPNLRQELGVPHAFTNRSLQNQAPPLLNFATTAREIQKQITNKRLLSFCWAFRSAPINATLKTGLQALFPCGALPPRCH